MPDHLPIDRSGPTGGEGPSRDLESRLDALGRGMVSEEARRAAPAPDFLAAVARRGVATTVGTWAWPIAVVAGILAIIISLIIRTGGTPQLPAVPPNKTGDDSGVNGTGAIPTFGWLWSHNRQAPITDLRLPSGAAAATDDPPSSAADSRHADRVDELLRSP